MEESNKEAEKVLAQIKSNGGRKEVLVTGGAGYLGSILVPMLLQEGYKVHILDRFYFGKKHIMQHQNNPNLKLIEMDISHHENVPHLLKEVDTVIHLSGISNDPSGDLDPNLTIQTNFLATISLARRAKAEGVKKFIFISSCSVYGASGHLFLDEQSEVGPVTLYALSKLQCENELIPLADSKFAVTVLRFATLFGYSPRMRFDLAVNVMAKRALQGKSIYLNGDGTQYRPFLHVKDASRAIMTVMKEDPSITNKQIFNVGNSKLNFMIKDLVPLIQSYFPESKIEKVENSKDNRSYRVSFRKFERICGFQALYDIEHGVREIEKAFKEGELKDMDDPIYYNLEVMKKHIKEPLIEYSVASSPRWTINNFSVDE
ncbi:NAD-dependent epimerase/dehydratase family protein [Candidatus Pacearchaeota archaeon]|nr:NAD-dependent epimerase/dehydratase family protein [Candidatus Pacearchaeota archaeon]